MSGKGNFDIEGIKVGKDFFFIAGPCVMEGEDFTFEIAKKLKKIFSVHKLKFIFKASFDKANRTSLSSFRGPGLKRGVEILREVKNRYGIPITTDIHTPSQAEIVAEVVDLIQIPAFLARQTDMILEASITGRAVNIKKGQFMSINEIIKAVEKAYSTGNFRIMVTERGTFFGYNDLVVDFRNIYEISRNNIPVVFDATHSVQRPGAGSVSGGDREFVYPLSLASVVCGACGLFLEVHPQPEKAMSDSATSIDFSYLLRIIRGTIKIKKRSVK